MERGTVFGYNYGVREHIIRLILRNYTSFSVFFYFNLSVVFTSQKSWWRVNITPCCSSKHGGKDINVDSNELNASRARRMRIGRMQYFVSRVRRRKVKRKTF